MNWLLNNAQILIFLVIIGSSVFGWIFKQLREQAELKRIEHERERRKLEQLRTGRVDEPDRPIAAQTRVSTPQAPSPSPAAPTTTGAGRVRLEEIAARRQAQLAELRRRRAEQLARAQSGGQSVPPQAQRQAQPGRQPAARPAPAQPAARPPVARQPRGKISRAPLSQGNPPRAPQAPMPSRRRRAKDQPVHESVEQHHLDVSIDDRHLEASFGSGAGSRPAAKSPAGDLRAMLQGSHIRDAILLSEILAPPVTMRKDHLSRG